MHLEQTIGIPIAETRRFQPEGNLARSFVGAARWLVQNSIAWSVCRENSSINADSSSTLACDCLEKEWDV